MFGLLNKIPRESTPRRRPGDPMPDDADYRLSGFTTGTRIATVAGWRPIESIALGDEVLTFDNGPQPVVAMTHGAHFVAGDQMPAPI